MASFSTSHIKRLSGPSPMRGVKRLCDGAQCPVVDGSQLLSYESFKCLEEPAQKKYFDDIFEVLSDWETFKKSCPRIDMMVHEHYASENRLSSDEQDATDAVQKGLNLKWGFAKKPARRKISPRMNERTRWVDDELRWNLDKSKFEIEQRGRFRSMPDTELRQYGFYNHISSSLLWYRLTIFIGEPQIVDTDGYKSSWDIKFHHTDSTSTLRLWDSKGSARAVFEGLKDSQDDALEFVNFLTTFKFPHTYDNVIAGTVA
jgi:hypothetical protein